MNEIAVTNKAMTGHVFISYLPDDPDWSSAQVNAVAEVLREIGIVVHMDLWTQPAGARFQSIGAWRVWVEESVIGASRIVCLVSPHYENAWENRTSETLDGMALQAISILGEVNGNRKNARGRLVTVRPKGVDSRSVPADLAYFLSFEWPIDRIKLLSWILDRQIPLHATSNEDAGREFSAGLSDGLILDGLHYPVRTDTHASTSEEFSSSLAIELDALAAVVKDATDTYAREMSLAFEASGVMVRGVTPPTTEVEHEVAAEAVTTAAADQGRQISRPSIGASGLWPAEDEWRAPLRDFPPPWASAWGDDVYGLWADLTVNGVTQRMRWIEPSGSEGFWMGSSKAERDAIVVDRVRQWASHTEQSMRKEYVESGFWFADTPCTQALWVAVVGKNPSHFSEFKDSLRRPVECVSWDDVKDKFLANLSLILDGMEGFFPCLPTEKEWEYAARAGTETPYWWGGEDDSSYANWDSLRQSTTPVCSYQPNPWGLFDVHGNVWEWCADAWQPVRDSLDQSPDDACRVSRGGSWVNPPSRGRAAHRGMWPRALVHQNQGFRFAISSCRDAKQLRSNEREVTARNSLKEISEDRGNLAEANLVDRKPQADVLSTSGNYWRQDLMDPSRWASDIGNDVYGLWADLTVNGATQRMRWIEPSGPEGFWMGSTKQERDAIKDKNVRDWANSAERGPRRVVVTEGFWLADTPCTQAFWLAVTGKNPSHFGKGREAPERPIENVNWDDVNDHFVKRFAQTPDWGTGNRLCLPSEQQWEYAARAGARTAYWWGDEWDAMLANANVMGDRGLDDKEGTTPVWRHAPNPWGLFDVHGNVWEWCSDPWQPRRDAPEARPDEDGRVVRGGSWISPPGGARAAYRGWGPRQGAYPFRGFRFALRSPAGPGGR